MGCEEIDGQLADYLAGTASPDATDTLERHLAECATCAEELQSLEATWQLLGALPAERPDSARMRGQIAAMRAGYERGLVSQRGLHIASRLGRAVASPATDVVDARRSSTAPSWVQVAAAAALVAFGVSLGRFTARDVSDDSPQFAELRQELHATQQLVTLALLEQPSASGRLKGVSWTEQIERPGDEVVAALLDTLLHDPNVNVRVAAIDALRRFGERDRVRLGALDALMGQTSPLVQLAVIDFVVELDERAAVPMLRQLSLDPALDETVRTRAGWGFQQLEEVL
ncbi:MAG: HEAT repeat domain-containing protein [Acidobacteria bacterium]|nr:HEAT repeat domain-containing protein [Acidobacteriota bacterium]